MQQEPGFVGLHKSFEKRRKPQQSLSDQNQAKEWRGCVNFISCIIEGIIRDSDKRHTIKTAVLQQIPRRRA